LVAVGVLVVFDQRLRDRLFYHKRYVETFQIEDARS
jgi:hypothetical protein